MLKKYPLTLIFFLMLLLFYMDMTTFKPELTNCGRGIEE